MSRGANIIGKCIVKLRSQRGWTQDALARKMQLAGFDVTRQIIAHIEAGNCAVTDTQMPYFVKVFRIGIEELFPVELRCGERMGDLEKLCPPKPPRKSRVE